MLEACLGHIEVEDGRTANENYEGADDVLDGTGYESVAGRLHAMLPSTDSP